MTIHKPIKLFLLGVTGLTLLCLPLSLVISETALTVVATIGFLGCMLGVFAWCWLDDGAPPPPLTNQLQVSHVRVIEADSYETVP
jgi:hypothetical protein